MDGGTPLRVEQLVIEQAKQRPEHVALCFGERRWTYARLQAAMERRAARLIRAGARPGDVIATTEPVHDETMIAFLACCRMDGAFLPLSPGLSATEVSSLMARARARLVLTADGAPHPACPSVPALPLALPDEPDGAAQPSSLPDYRDTEAIALIQSTSGTTGSMPKLVRMTHRTLTWHRFRQSWWAGSDDVVYRPGIAYFPVRDLCELLYAGATFVLSHTTHPARIEAELVAYRVTGLVTVPAVLRLLADQRGTPPAGLALRVLSFSAAPLPRAVQEAAQRRYGLPILQAYGSTEGGSMIRMPDAHTPDGSIGTPYAGVLARIVAADGADVARGAIGELIVRSMGVMRDYLDDPAATARVLRDGWLWTGDLARCDGEGFYYLEGRRALHINVGGFKVTPEEIEAVLELHPGVREAVVIPMPDAVHGEVPRAVIVPYDAPPTAATLRRFCRERLAAYKVPRRFEFRTELPRSPLGKVLRQQL